MELNIKERTKNSVLMSFKDLDIGFLNLLAAELLKDKRVLNAYPRKPHPLLDEVEFFLLVTDGTDMIALLEEKVNAIKSSYEEFRKKFMNSLGKASKS
ncbi:MAG TPA: RpoL/Rpb11 RNA polymerase subunit family protein [Geobacterales bacterium]|nr:RpoL/Rpb11 RNA polymerase subunit family protein [Geobacterales bacterium]